jgi:hypothetical protein
MTAVRWPAASDAGSHGRPGAGTDPQRRVGWYIFQVSLQNKGERADVRMFGSSVAGVEGDKERVPVQRRGAAIVTLCCKGEGSEEDVAGVKKLFSSVRHRDYGRVATDVEERVLM